MSRAYEFPDPKRAELFFEACEKASIEQEWMVSIKKTHCTVDIELDDRGSVPPIEWFDEVAADLEGKAITKRSIGVVYSGGPLPWTVAIELETPEGEYGDTYQTLARFAEKPDAKLFVAALAAKHRGEFPEGWLT